MENNIHELDRFDSDSMTFRYPTNKHGSANLPSDLTHVNLQVLHEGMEAVWNLLTGAVGVVRARLQYVWDNEPDMDRDP